MTTGHHVHLLPQTHHLRAPRTTIRDRDATRADFVTHARSVVRLLPEPMLATGGSANAAIDVLRDAGVREEHIVLVDFPVSPEGIAAVHAAHPAVRIVTGSIEDCLNDDAFTLPGIGDFGDRFFGTADSAVTR